MKTRLVVLLIISNLLLSAISVFGRGTRSADPLSHIQADYENGALTLDQKANLVIDAIKFPDKLPNKYAHPLALAEQGGICPTMALRDIKVEWNQLSPQTQQRFSDAFARPTAAFTYVTPSGFFTIHYDLTGADAVPSTDGNSNSVPDYIERVSDYLDSTLDMHVARGFLLPPSDGGLGGDTTFDVYFEEMGYYGYATPEAPGSAPWSGDYYSYLTLHRNFFGFPPNNDPEGDQLGAAKVTIAHEFHHCVQFAYDANESIWFMELDATCMEDMVFNATDDNYNYLSEFFSAPQKSLMEVSLHEYACFTWDLYLAQKFDTTLMRSIWEGARFSSVYNTISDTLLAKFGWTQDSAFADYAVWNFITNTRNDGQHHDEAAAYPLITVGQTFSSYPVPTQNGPSNPAGYAASYVQFFPGASIGTLHIAVDGDNARQWKFYVIKSTAENVHTVQEIAAPSPSYAGGIDIPQFETYFRVALVAVNLTEFSSAAAYSYSATITPPYEVATALSTDSVVYPGSTRNFKLKITNSSVLPDIYRIVITEGFNWITTDTLNVAVGANDDSTINIPVHPPQGTPLQTQSLLQFAARSWGDTLVVDTSSIVAVTKLYHGDNNFSGGINILDLVYIVSFLFSGGPTPAPVVQAGDFNCDNLVTVTDLTSLVKYLFQSGPKPPCNPY